MVDENQHALGLIFAGTSDAPESVPSMNDVPLAIDPDKPLRIEGYGVANPISEVLDRLKIDLLIDGF